MFGSQMLYLQLLNIQTQQDSIMATHQPQKRPISPQQLFERLLSGNFKELECVDQAQKVKDQRIILLSLIDEYQAEIKKRIADQVQLQRMLQLRAKLRIELDDIRRQRKSIDENISNEITRFKKTPIQIRQQSHHRCQIEQIRAKNSRMSIRLKELIDYARKIQHYNTMLEKQNLVIKQAKVRPISECIQIGDWRSKIQTLRKQHEMHSLQLRTRIKQQQQKSLRELQQQEADIAYRNRERISSFQHRNHRKYFY